MRSGMKWKENLFSPVVLTSKMLMLSVCDTLRYLDNLWFFIFLDELNNKTLSSILNLIEATKPVPLFHTHRALIEVKIHRSRKLSLAI